LSGGPSAGAKTPSESASIVALYRLEYSEIVASAKSNNEKGKNRRAGASWKCRKETGFFRAADCLRKIRVNQT
jgi:hypothetical protein